MPGSVLLSHGETPHYHRRWAFSLPSSGWDRVVPTRYGRQAKLLSGVRVKMHHAFSAIQRSEAFLLWPQTGKVNNLECFNVSKCLAETRNTNIRKLIYFRSCNIQPSSIKHNVWYQLRVGLHWAHKEHNILRFRPHSSCLSVIWSSLTGN